MNNVTANEKQALGIAVPVSKELLRKTIERTPMVLADGIAQLLHGAVTQKGVTDPEFNSVEMISGDRYGELYPDLAPVPSDTSAVLITFKAYPAASSDELEWAEFNKAAKAVIELLAS